MLNKAMIIGRLGRDPELRYTQAGKPCATLNIATDESYTDRNGNKVAKAEWHRVQVWDKAAEACGNGRISKDRNATPRKSVPSASSSLTAARMRGDRRALTSSPA